MYKLQSLPAEIYHCSVTAYPCSRYTFGIGAGEGGDGGGGGGGGGGGCRRLPGDSE